MLDRMKITVILPDELVREAQELASRERTTLRALIETGLSDVIKQRSTDPSFELADASVDGRGLQPAFQGAPWERVRDAIYDSPA